jgi:hypothetical protein
MANDINKILGIPQWQTVTTPTTPDSGYVKIYPKTDPLTNNLYWYVQNESGYEKKVALDYLFYNGFSLTTLSSGNPYYSKIDLNIGSGLSFSGTQQVFVSGLTSGSLLSTNSFSNGYVLSATSSGSFTWIPFTSIVVSGDTNSVAKFTGVNSVGDSMIYDNGSTVQISYNPSLSLSVTFSVWGSAHVYNNLYFNNNTLQYINNSSINTSLPTYALNFNNGAVSYKYYQFNTDTTSFTFSLMSFIQGGDTVGNKYVNILSNNITIGTSSTASVVNLYSSSSSLRIQDGSQGLNKYFISDSTGLGSWQTPYGYNGLTTSGIGFGINSGYGLTISSGAIIWDKTIIGTGLTVSTVGTVSLATTGVSAGTYGASVSTPVITVDAYGRITTITTTASSGSGGSGNSVKLSYLDKNWVANNVPVGAIGTASGSTVSGTPLIGSYIGVYINGVEVQVGNATTSAPCYFGPNISTPRGFTLSNYVLPGDYLYWNPTYSGYGLENGFRISLHYLA